jgi:hypothetical protein
MQTRTSARAAGLLFITATAAGVASVALLRPSDPLRTHQVAAGALMVLIMAAAIAMIPPMLFPILKEHNEALALGYVVARSIEVVLLLPAALGPLAMLSHDSERFSNVRALSQTYDSWGGPASVIFFCLSVVLLNYVLFRSRIVPRLISGWALVAVLPYLADGLLLMFGLVKTSSPLHALLVVPLAVNETALALWLLVKGLRA